MKDIEKKILDLAESCLYNEELRNAGFTFDVSYGKLKISIDANGSKGTAKVTVATPKKKQDFSAVDALYNNPPSEEEIAKETEERNKRLKEKFSSVGNVQPTIWTGNEH